MHQVGAHIVADVLESCGWNVRFLGSNVPTSAIMDRLMEEPVAVLGLSVTMLFNVPQLKRLIEAVHEELAAAAPRVIVGGAVFRWAPDLARELGVESFTDVRSLLASSVGLGGHGCCASSRDGGLGCSPSSLC